jgi:hypothetical protein
VSPRVDDETLDRRNIAMIAEAFRDNDPETAMSELSDWCQRQGHDDLSTVLDGVSREFFEPAGMEVMF